MIEYKSRRRRRVKIEKKCVDTRRCVRVYKNEEETFLYCKKIGGHFNKAKKWGNLIRDFFRENFHEEN